MRTGFENFSGKILLVVVLMSAANAADLVEYADQANWEGDCLIGESQTPIDIKPMKVKYCPDMGYYKFTLLCEEFMEQNEGNDFKITNAAGKAFAFFYDKKTNSYEAYEDVQLHWHTTSEHTIGGQSYDAEMHLFLVPAEVTDLPKEALGSYADFDFSESTNANMEAMVIGFLFKEDATAETDIFSGTREDEELNVYWNLNNMFGCPMEKYFYMYHGSTTTPPCLENIKWFVSRVPLPLKTESLAKINDKIVYETGESHRDIQDLNNRDVYLVGAPCMASEEL